MALARFQRGHARHMLASVYDRFKDLNRGSQALASRM
jgi:hypothetical protein